jgi:hypothetical protein
MLRSVTSGEAGGAELSGGDVEVSWADREGRRCAAGLESVAGVAFEDALPVREFVSYRRQRHFPGLWWLAKTGRHVGYESWLERDHLMVLDSDCLVTGVSSQPFTLRWSEAGRTVAHTPDYFARMADGSAVVVDVRPAARVRPRDRVKFEATAAACERLENWSFRLVHELDPVLAVNVRWLSGYRHPRYGDQSLGLLDGVSRVADPIRALPVLFHLLWRGDLAADLSVPIGDGTWVSDGGPRERGGAQEGHPGR